jgi:hypothetical protein
MAVAVGVAVPKSVVVAVYIRMEELDPYRHPWMGWKSNDGWATKLPPTAPPPVRRTGSPEDTTQYAAQSYATAVQPIHGAVVSR